MKEMINNTPEYKQGFQDGYDKAIEDGIVRLSFWKWDSQGDKYCAECGMLEPDCLPGACVIWPPEKRYCFYCGRKMINIERGKVDDRS